MRRGPWHQCGDKSQKIVQEQLQNGVGVGVILSPRDLSMANAVRYADAYHDLGAHVLIDQQFYIPQFSNNNLTSYPTSRYRTSVSSLREIRDDELSRLAAALAETNEAVGADGVIAPAVVYEAARGDIVELNARLFSVAKSVGDERGVPTYATVVLGRSTTSSLNTVTSVLSQATALDADGWYYAFEFEPERVPSSGEAVYWSCVAGLTLACTGKPVLHAYAGPMALLSLGFGATGTAVGHWQNLWRFTPGRWQPPSGQGGGGDAPPRLFSTALWGTIVYPDETAQLSPDLRDQVLTHSPFFAPVAAGSPSQWPKWDANKHLVHVICSAVAEMAGTQNARANATDAIGRLRAAVALHSAIAHSGVALRDETDAYQANWVAALEQLLAINEDDFEFLSLTS